VDIVTELADRFSGNIRFPEGFVAEGDEFIFINVRRAGDFVIDRFSQGFLTEVGQTSWGFDLTAPRSATGAGWVVDVSCSSCDEGISAEDHFPTTVNGDPMSLNDADAFLFPRNQNYSDINMTLISIAPEPDPEDPPVVAPMIFLLNDE